MSRSLRFRWLFKWPFLGWPSLAPFAQFLGSRGQGPCLFPFFQRYRTQCGTIGCLPAKREHEVCSVLAARVVVATASPMHLSFQGTTSSHASTQTRRGLAETMRAGPMGFGCLATIFSRPQPLFLANRYKYQGQRPPVMVVPTGRCSFIVLPYCCDDI